MKQTEKVNILRLDEILKEKRITNRKFAEMLGKSPQYTNSIVKERAGASINMLSTMADVLGVQLSEVFIKR